MCLRWYQPWEFPPLLTISARCWVISALRKWCVRADNTYYSQRIRDVFRMCYINWYFTYLLYWLCTLHQARLLSTYCTSHELPSSVVTAPSLDVFKKNLKTHLFQQSYSRWHHLFHCVLLCFIVLYRVLEAASAHVTLIWTFLIIIIIIRWGRKYIPLVL